jgi:hypothetical protein
MARGLGKPVFSLPVPFGPRRIFASLDVEGGAPATPS